MARLPEPIALSKALAALPPDDFRRLDFQGKIPHFPTNAAV